MEKDVNFDNYRIAITLVENYTPNQEGSKIYPRPDFHKQIITSLLPIRSLHPAWPSLDEKIKEYFNLSTKIIKPYNIIELPFTTGEIEALYEGLTLQWFMPGEQGRGFTLNIYPYGDPVLLRHMGYKEPFLVFLVDISTNEFNHQGPPPLN